MTFGYKTQCLLPGFEYFRVIKIQFIKMGQQTLGVLFSLTPALI